MPVLVKLQYRYGILVLFKMRNAYKILTGKSEENKPFSRCGCRLKENITTESRELG